MLNSMLTLYSKNPDEIIIKNPSLFYILKLYSDDPELLSETDPKWYERLSNLD